jgi:Ca-activated chloride channel homolog
MRSKVLAGMLLLGALQGTVPSSAVDKRELPVRYRDWLAEVFVLITPEEQKEFLKLEKDYQRDAFIARFWKSRDLYPETERNEFKLAWDARLEEARERYGNIDEDRARLLLLRGEPGAALKTDCGTLLWPVEVWHYPAALDLPRDYYVLFYQPRGGGRYQRWTPQQGYEVLVRLAGVDDEDRKKLRKLEHRPVLTEKDLLVERVEEHCRGTEARALTLAIYKVNDQDRFGSQEFAERRPAVKDPEWLATFAAVSTDVKPGTPEMPALPAALEIAFPGREGGRTVVAGTVQVPAAEAAVADLAGNRSHNFLLTGEVLKEAELFESFRYRFDLPIVAGAAPAPPGSAPGSAPGSNNGSIPLLFERLLRPGEYTLVVKLEDINSGRTTRIERQVAVPAVEEGGASAGGPGSSVAAAPAPAAEGPLAEAYRSLAGGPGIKLTAPPGDVLVGPVRIDAATIGEGIRRVAFLLDGQAVLTKSRPPYGVELNLGAIPKARTVRAVAYDEAGREVASDELVLNAGAQPFTVRLVEPRAGRRAAGAVEVRADVHLPDGGRLDRLEIFLDEARVATLYQEPFRQTVTLPHSGATSYVRAVGYLADGATAEDLVLLNAPEAAEEIDVQLVEVYAAVKGRDGRPIADLKREEVAVLEDGAEQKIQRFERVAEIPLHVVLVVDTSASMAPILPEVRKAAAEFLRATLTPRDRAAVVTFSDSPTVAARFSADVEELSGSLAGLRAERGTALFDCIVFALQYMKGVRGQSALLVITDGEDRASRFDFGETLELARRSGVAVYGLGIGLSRLQLEPRMRLGKLAEETGGRAFFPEAGADLGPIWAGIGEELRSRWLVAYQSSKVGGSGEFRKVELRVARPGVEVQAMRGYHPK